MKKVKNTKAWLPAAVIIGLVLPILVGALVLNFLQRPMKWKPLDPEAYVCVQVGNITLFGEHAQDFIRLVNEQITTPSESGNQTYSSQVYLHGTASLTSLHFSSEYEYVTLSSSFTSLRPNDWCCGPELVARMKELCDPKASAQPMPTAEEVLHATLTQDGETVTLDTDQIAAICAVLPQLRTQEIVRNLYVKEANADWLLTLELPGNTSMMIYQVPFLSTNYVALGFSQPTSYSIWAFRLDDGFDVLAGLFP